MAKLVYAGDLKSPDENHEGSTPFPGTIYLKEIEYLALQMAAHGCIAGCLHEWPFLMDAFEKLGMHIDEHAQRIEMKETAKKCMIQPFGTG